VHAWDRDPGRRRGPRAKTPAVSLRNAVPEDDDALRTLWHELMTYHVALDPRFALADDADEAFQGYLEAARTRDDYRVRVAELRGAPIGFAVSCILPNSPVYKTRWIGYVNDIVVTRGQRGRGVGELLVEDALWWLERNGAESIEVYVARSNEGAQRFWRRMGGRDYLDRLTIDVRRRSEDLPDE
jgi:GNAT superfamily N-acetyltransferase